MKNIDESYVVKKYAEGQSTISLAKELNTYPKKIERILKKNGHALRSRSESQSLAIKKASNQGTKKNRGRKAKNKHGC